MTKDFDVPACTVVGQRDGMVGLILGEEKIKVKWTASQAHARAQKLPPPEGWT